MTTLLIILWLAWACAWLFLFLLGVLALMGAIKAWDWLRKRRERPSIQQVGPRDYVFVPEDLQ